MLHRMSHSLAGTGVFPDNLTASTLEIEYSFIVLLV